MAAYLTKPHQRPALIAAPLNTTTATPIVAPGDTRLPPYRTGRLATLASHMLQSGNTKSIGPHDQNWRYLSIYPPSLGRSKDQGRQRRRPMRTSGYEKRSFHGLIWAQFLAMHCRNVSFALFASRKPEYCFRAPNTRDTSMTKLEKSRLKRSPPLISTSVRPASLARL